jgi:hypothetical protein
MTDSMKWVVTGSAVIIIIGAALGSRMINHDPAPAASDPVVAMSDSSHGYPAPEVTIDSRLAKPAPDTEAVSHSSSLYGDGYSYSRRHRSGRKYSHKKAKPDVTGLPAGADPEMGVISADDKKLRQAEAEAARADHEMSTQPSDVGPNGR